MPESMDLAGVLANRTWLRREGPFPHVVARHVFERSFYRSLESHVDEILQRRLSESPAPGRLARNLPGYDAYGVGFDELVPEPLGVFLSRTMRRMMCDLFDVEPTPYVFAGLHHHAAGGDDGFIHNDYNPVWFPRAVNGHLRCPRETVCAYKTGAGSLAAAEKTEVVRAVAMIFFLLNDGWQPGDGGETGVFAARDSDVRRPAVRVPPENNSLIMFECTPRSFHAYLGGNRRPRTSIIMWVHRTRGDAVAKYGEEALERWKA